MQFFKKYNQESVEDIVRYIEKLLNIKIDNTHYISDKEFEVIKKEYIDNFNKIIPLKRIQKYNIFSIIIKSSIFIVFLGLLSFFVTYDTSKNDLIETKEIIAIENNIKQAPVKKEIKTTIPKIKAVVGNSVLIENDWLSIGDSFKGYKVESITKEYVVLNYKEQTIKVYRIND